MVQMKAEANKSSGCLEIAIRKLGGPCKNLLVLRELYKQPRRFGALRRALPWISATALTRALKALENDGLIARKVTDTRPLAVTYTLLYNDPLLREIVDSLTRWGRQNAPRPGPR